MIAVKTSTPPTKAVMARCARLLYLLILKRDLMLNQL
jgi:hypothetical protein